MKFQLLALAAVLAAAQAVVPPQWERLGAAPDGAAVSMIFAVEQVGADWLSKTFEAVSDPSSSRYGQYVDHETLWKNVHGEEECLAHVLSFLDTHSIKYELTRDRAYVKARMTVAQARVALEAEFSVFRHRQTNMTVVRTDKAELPAAVAHHIDFAVGHNTFPTTPRHSVRQSAALGTSPSSIDSAYNMNGYTSTNPNNNQAIASFLKQYFSPKDLASFQTEFKLPSRAIDKVVGPNVEAIPGLEANLDVQYIGATGRNISTWFVSTAQEDNHDQEGFLEWIAAQINDTTSPYVHSVSYGDVEASIPIAYKTRVDLEFQKMGSLGRTILVAAGDSGVGCNPDKTFQPDWPTSSPFVTSVGGTSGSVAWSDGGGGFSNTYGTPSYQADAVKAYLSSGTAPASRYFNASGRAYPDVAAFATNFEIVYHGSTIGVDGTSCATPTFAGVLAALNDVRLANNKPVLGFVNPLLYQLGAKSPQAFNDVTEGANGQGACPGFKAAKGWDPATGWGSPNFAALRQLAA